VQIKKAEMEKEKLKQQLMAQNAEAAVDYPSYWVKQDEDFQLYDVLPGTTEYASVIDRFSESLNYAVIKLQRVQNKRLWKWYFLRRQEIATNNNNNSNEAFLFHGSNVQNVPVITKEGLDTRVANLGGAIGAGIYFAVKAKTSTGYVACSFPSIGPQMLLCRVALGAVTRGQSGLRRPPIIPNKPGMLYDSVDGTLGVGEKMYAIFDNHQSYPEYIIHYNDGRSYAGSSTPMMSVTTAVAGSYPFHGNLSHNQFSLGGPQIMTNGGAIGGSPVGGYKPAWMKRPPTGY